MAVSLLQHCRPKSGTEPVWTLRWLLLVSLISHGSCANHSVSICVLAPNIQRDCELFSLPKVKPAVDLGIEKVRQMQVVSGVDLNVVYKDSRCSDIDATIAAFEMKERRVDMFFGPVNDMALNSVAQYAARWNIPLVTPGGMSAFYFENKFDKPTLTRIGLRYDELVRVVIDILRYYNWNKVKVIYEGRTASSPVFPEYYTIAGDSFSNVMMAEQYENDNTQYSSMFQSLDDLLTRKIASTYAAPLNPSQRMFSLHKIGPGVEIGIEYVRQRQILRELNISVKFVDTNFSSRIAPIRAMQLMERKQAHLFLGPVYDYSLAPVARYAPHWAVPIVTPGGFAHDFKTNRAKEYETLTRIGPAFESTADFIGKIIQAHAWSRAILVYQGDGQRFVFPRFCFLAASAYIYHFQRDRYKHIARHDFHIYLHNKESYDSLLRNRIGEKYSGESKEPLMVLSSLSSII